MTLRIVPTAAVTFEVWRDLWLDYVGGQIAADSPLHRHTYERLCAADALHGRMAMEGMRPSASCTTTFIRRPGP
jgi:predicted protein tyrosine phosphatase